MTKSNDDKLSKFSFEKERNLELLCETFESDWRNNRRPRIAELLAATDVDQRAKLFRTLLELDVEYRRRGGETPGTADYAADFPEFREIVNAVFAGKLPSLSAAGAQSTADHWIVSEKPGAVVDKYKLLQQIGEGGFGVVFMAEQRKPMRRKVALKIIKPGMDTKEVIARFEAERQALALMDHPNIAHVLDAGVTESGRPFFAMELVKGVPLTEFCDCNKLTSRQRLELFVTVCRAVQHAHQKGVIHRDLKPSNVMVTLHDNKPMPKIIDFGVAKAISQQLTEKTLFTAYGQMVGTPIYMSPEQAQMSGLDIDTRSDIYSLGVILYELLTGTTPLEAERLRNTAYIEMQRLIVEEEAPKPSSRLTTLGEQQAKIALQRGTDPKRLRQLLSGDLDSIVMKALDKERDRRYESASNFAEDIERLLNDDVVEARPPSAVYRLQKFVRRNRGPVIAVSALLVALCLGLAGTSIGFVSATREAKTTRLAEEEANLERDRAVEAERDAVSARQQVAARADELARRLYLIHVANADKALQENNYLFAQVEIDACQEEQRGWEWQYLTERIQAMFPLVLPGAEQPNYTRDDKRLIAIGAIGTPEHRMVMTWDLESGKVVGDPLEHEFPLYSLAVSADNKRIVAGDVEGTLVVWDAESGDELWSKKVHKKRFDGLAFSPDGRFIATTSFDRRLKVVDATDGTVIFTTKPFKSCTRKPSFSPNGRWIASGLLYGGAMLINAATGEIVDKFSEDEGPQRVSAFDPSGQRIATGHVDGSIKVWNWDGKQRDEIASWPATNREFVEIHFNADGTRLVSTDRANAVKVWDATTGEQLAALTSPGMVYSMAFNHGGDEIALFSLNGGIRIWRYLGEEDGLKVTPLDGAVEAMFNPDGSLILASSPIHWDGLPFQHLTNHDGPDSQPEAASILDAESGKEVCTIDDPVYAASWSPDGQQIVASSAVEDAIRTYGVATGEYLQSFPSKTQRFIISRVDPTSQRLVTFSYDGMLRVLNFKSGKEALEHSVLPENPGVSQVMRAGLARNANHIGIGLYPEHRVEIWDTRSATRVGSCSAPGQFTRRFTFSDDGNRVYVGGTGGQLTELDTVSGQKTKRFLGHTGAVLAIAISPNEDQIVAGGNSGQVIIWDVAIGCRLVTLTAGDTPVISLDWSSDGHRIVAGKVDGTIQIWTLPNSP